MRLLALFAVLFMAVFAIDQYELNALTDLKMQNPSEKWECDLTDPCNKCEGITCSDDKIIGMFVYYMCTSG